LDLKEGQKMKDFHYDLCEICPAFEKIQKRFGEMSQAMLISKCIFTCIASYDDNNCIIACPEYVMFLLKIRLAQA